MEPPGPFPNPEVKRRSADGIGTIGPVRVGRCQVYARLQEIGVGLFFWQANLSRYELETYQGMNLKTRYVRMVPEVGKNQLY